MIFLGVHTSVNDTSAIKTTKCGRLMMLHTENGSSRDLLLVISEIMYRVVSWAGNIMSLMSSVVITRLNTQ
jgi:hypothetical protein